MNGPRQSEPSSLPRTRPLAPFAVVAELSVLYEITSLGVAESEEQLGREAAEKVSRLFGARYFAILRGPLLDQKVVVLWGLSNEHELKSHLLHPGPHQFRFSFPLGTDEVVTVFAEQARPVDERQTRLYTILARRIQAAMTTLKNIADRTRAMEAIRRSEERFVNVIRNMGDGLIVTDVEGRIELMNPVAESMTGWTAADASGKLLSEVFHVADDETRKPLADVVAPLMRDGGSMGFGQNAVLISRDGIERPITGTASALKDEYGQTNGMVLIFSDRTAERQLQKDLQEALRKAQNYLDTAAVMLVALDRTGRVTLLNRKAEEILKVKAQDALGADWFECFVPEKEREDLRRFFSQIIGGADAHAIAYHENKVLGRDGSERTIAWQNVALRDQDGNIVGTLSSGIDITEIREAQTRMAEQLEELRRWHKVTLDREDFVMRLKKEVNDLCKRLGEPPRYEITA